MNRITPAAPGQHLGHILAVCGVLLLLTAFAWWFIVFQQVMGAGYLGLGESLYCAAAGSTICDLAMALCKSNHILGIRWYSPHLLWIAIALVSLHALLNPQLKKS